MNGLTQGNEYQVKYCMLFLYCTVIHLILEWFMFHIVLLSTDVKCFITLFQMLYKLLVCFSQS